MRRHFVGTHVQVVCHSCQLFADYFCTSARFSQQNLSICFRNRIERRRGWIAYTRCQNLPLFSWCISIRIGNTPRIYNSFENSTCNSENTSYTKRDWFKNSLCYTSRKISFSLPFFAGISLLIKTTSSWILCLACSQKNKSTDYEKRPSIFGVFPRIPFSIKASLYHCFTVCSSERI